MSPDEGAEFNALPGCMAHLTLFTALFVAAWWVGRQVHRWLG